MSKFGLTRVSFIGDTTSIIATNDLEENTGGASTTISNAVKETLKQLTKPALAAKEGKKDGK